MTTVVASYLELPPSDVRLRDAFLRWQCRARQLAMRQAQGRPDAAVTPDLFIGGNPQPFGQIITLLNKAPTNSTTAEFQHMGRATHDPAQRREKALTFLSASYYQKHREFSDTLTASFQPGSPSADTIRQSGSCHLRFDAYNQRFDLACNVHGLGTQHPLYQATWWHNFLFNPQLAPGSVVLAFMPDWQASSAEPGFT